jgi:predicted ATP-grasp superfamily ATP-dependent carboligase
VALLAVDSEVLAMAGYEKQSEVPEAKAPTAVALVDPYSSGRYLVYELHKRGIPIVCVRSSLSLGPFFLAAYETHKEYFARTVDYNGDLAATVKELTDGQHDIKALLPGSEPGVELADQLSEALGVATNGTELTWARRDKAGMQDRLKECGVPSAEQIKSSNVEDSLVWAREREARYGAEIAYPVVVKPTGGMGGEGVFFCASEEDLVNAHKELLSSTCVGSGAVIEQLALQEFLDGTEYIIDTCTLDGNHLCCAVWRYTKRKGVPWSPKAIVTQYQEILASDAPECEALVSYVFKVLDAVGLVHGPCHTEVMMTKRGPILVEVNARMHGVQGPLLIEKATGIGLASYVADAMMSGWQGNGGALKSHFEAGSISAKGRWMYKREQCSAIVMLISHVEGYLAKDIAELVMDLKLPSVQVAADVFPSLKESGFLRQTTDLNTMAGYAIMLHSSAEQMSKDIATLREKEEAGLYAVTKEPGPMSRQLSPEVLSGSFLGRQRSVSGDFMSRQMSPSIEKAPEMWERSQQEIEEFMITMEETDGF